MNILTNYFKSHQGKIFFSFITLNGKTTSRKNLFSFWTKLKIPQKKKLNKKLLF